MSRGRARIARLPRSGAVLLLLLLALGCGRGEPIRVAFAGPVSGASARDGLSAVRAIELVFERENAAGGVAGRPLVLDVYDDANDPARARANAPRIADQSDTVAVIGHNLSTSSMAAGEVYAERGLPALATAATSVGVTRDNPWYFRTIYNDRDQGQLIVAYVRAVLGARSFGIAHETEAYGAYLARVMLEAAPEAELGVGGVWPLDPAGPRLDARLDVIAREATRPGAPPVLVLAMQPAAGAALVERLRDRGFGGQLVVTDALASQAFAEGFRARPEERARPGFFSEGIYASTPFLFDSAGRRAGAFARDYVARHDEPPDWYAAFAADAAAVVVEGLRRAGLSPTPATLAEDRRALRDQLASIGPFDPVQGVTGPTFFDAVGDAEKPVPMGRFLNGEIVSAFGQLRLAPPRSARHGGGTGDPTRLFALGERRLLRTDVARVGVRARRFGELRLSEGVFQLDFDLWFRHQADRGVEDVVFTNAVEPVEIGEPVDESSVGPLQYRLYRVRGLFRADIIEPPYGGHVLGLGIRHRERTRDELILAIDPVGMNLGRSSDRTQRGAPARRLLGASDWTVSDVMFFEEEVQEPALGHPDHLHGPRGARAVSELTIAVFVKRQPAGLRGSIPAGAQGTVLGASLAGSLLLLGVGRRSLSVWRFGLQALLALLVLASAEPVIGNALQGGGAGRLVGRLPRVFDVLWWLVPALLVVVAVDRFVWRRAEARSGNPVPSLLRWFVTFLVLLFAVFGVVAFVYDYRLTGLLATSGVVAMIIGLAVQLNITNLFAGVALNLERPFRVGDWIMIHGRTPDPESSVIGMVVDINWRTTRLRTADDTEIVIPNGIISEKTITNFMHPGEMSRFELRFTVDQAHPPDQVIPLMKEALQEVLGVENQGPLADPPPSVRINRTTDMGIEYAVRYRIVPREVSPAKARHTVNDAILRHLRAAGITLAYPSRRLFEERPSDA